MDFQQFLEAVHPDTRDAWEKHFKSKDAHEKLNQEKAKKDAETAKSKGSQSNKAKE